MPQATNNAPPVMTWGKALPVLAVSGVFDALKFMFQQFWFFGPALIGTGLGAFIGSYAGSAVGSTLGTLAGGAAAYFASPVLIIFGAVMAMAVAFAGWLVIGLGLVMTNPRIFKAGATGGLWFAGSLGLGVTPLLGSIPFMTGTLVKLYATQIKHEKAEYKKWERERSARAAILTPYAAYADSASDDASRAPDAHRGAVA